MKKSILSIKNLEVGYRSSKSDIKILKEINFDLYEGETIGIVGESGCGKSLTSLSIMGLLSPPLKIQSGEIIFNNKIISNISNNSLNNIRGKEISMVFQEPMTSLNPVFTIGDQIVESMIFHLKIYKKEAMKKAEELLELVGIPSAKKRLKDYPHQLSGGMRQRVMIAIALACDPKLLIADEPTTALDVTIEAQILSLLQEIKRKRNMSMIFITHDLGVLTKMADKVLVMYGGSIIETATVSDIFKKPLHPYTQGLWKAIPGPTNLKKRLYTIPGTVPAPDEEIRGCRFASRCNFAKDVCYQIEPSLLVEQQGHAVACHLYQEKGGSAIEKTSNNRS